MVAEEDFYSDRSCFCGCGQRISVRQYHKYYGVPKYVHGHNGRGLARTEETKHKISGKNKGKPSWCKGLTKETSKSVAVRAGKMQGRRQGVRQRRNISLALRGRSSHFRGKSYQEIYGDRAGEEVKKRCVDKYIRKRLSAASCRPNKLEVQLGRLLQKLFPGEWKYVGGGQFVLGGKCPDFVNVNGQKKIVELFGDHWHKPEEEQQRIDLFAQYGYQTLVVWEHELESSIGVLKGRLKEFGNGC